MSGGELSNEARNNPLAFKHALVRFHPADINGLRTKVHSPGTHG